MKTPRSTARSSKTAAAIVLDDASLIDDAEVVPTARRSSKIFMARRPKPSRLAPNSRDCPPRLKTHADLRRKCIGRPGARQWRAQQIAGESGGGGLWGAIVSAVIDGAIKGAASSRPKAPARYTSYASSRRKKKKTTRRTRKPSLESIFREILSGR
jgi:hypothetical protein